jgi:hypothetical protein
MQLTLMGFKKDIISVVEIDTHFFKYSTYLFITKFYMYCLLVLFIFYNWVSILRN